MHTPQAEWALVVNDADELHWRRSACAGQHNLDDAVQCRQARIHPARLRIELQRIVESIAQSGFHFVSKFARRVMTSIPLAPKAANLRYARIEASDHFNPHTAGFA
ncbi:hypothetical protein [Burkholderia sp. F1]|uniref:hypothetical protein n=1 Tax=Burkholderia sp. F1 TaxID=3366817 RepID=UPI003D758A67